jgi:hypothetical protein
LWAFLAASAAAPLAAAWHHNRRTSLVHAMAWATAAWLAWTVTAVMEALDGEHLASRSVGLALTGCAGVAVLGARRPGAAAWNFVVAGLLVVLLRPLWEGLGEVRLRSPHEAFLAAVVAVAGINYVPTRLGLSAFLVGVGCAVDALPLLGWQYSGAFAGSGAGWVGLAAWIGWAALQRSPATPFDRLWLSYRDRCGLLWAYRIREQFNSAAAHAGWPVVLAWSGLRPAGTVSPEALATLQAVLKRFAPE